MLRFAPILSRAALLVLATATGCDDNGSASAPPPDAQPAVPAEPAATPEAAPEATPEAADATAGVQRAQAQLQSAAGKNVSGTVTFTRGPEGVAVEGTLNGLEPGKHGFHVHETGDCSAADFSSAGGHFNPANVQHGAPTDEVHHPGDMGNLEVGSDGTATVSITMPELSMDEGDPAYVIGKAVVVHAKADDLKSQPSGDAGGRVACGVISPAE